MSITVSGYGRLSYHASTALPNKYDGRNLPECVSGPSSSAGTYLRNGGQMHYRALPQNVYYSHTLPVNWSRKTSNTDSQRWGCGDTSYAVYHIPASSYHTSGANVLRPDGSVSLHSDSTDVNVEQAMQDLKAMLELMEKEKQPMPRGVQDLTAYGPGFPAAEVFLQNGALQYIWGAKITTGGAPGETVIAYEKEADKQGGLVRMQDGTVKKMTADEFAKAKFTGKKPK